MVAIITWFLGSKLGRLAGVGIIASLLISGAYMKGRWDGASAKEAEYKQSSLETLRKRAESDDKIHRLPNNARRRELSKWVSDE